MPATQTTAAIDARDLTHVYPATRSRRKKTGPATALDHVSFSVQPGEIFGILGPNGGGKTTLFKIISTMLRPTCGAVSVFGHDAVNDPQCVREQLGVVFQMPSLDAKLTAEENLTHQGHLYGVRGADLRQRVGAALAGVNLLDRRGDRVEHFSGGMRRRVELAKALLHHPRLLLLDEPATGLDPGARRDVWQQLERLRTQQGVTVALTTHLMEEADRCDRLAILAHGKLVALDTPANLKSRIGGDVVTIEAERLDGSDGTAELARLITERLGPWGGTTAAPAVVEDKVRLEIPNGSAFVATLASALPPGRVRAITVGRPTLEDVFMDLTGQALYQEPRESDVASH